MGDEDKKTKDPDETSGDDDSSSKKNDPVSYTEDDIRNFKSDASMWKGRHEKAEAKAKTLQEENDSLQDRIDKIEAEGLKPEDKDGRTNLQLRSDLRVANRKIKDLEEENTSLKEQAEGANKVQLERKAEKAVKDYTNVSAEDLLDMPEDKWPAFLKKYGTKADNKKEEDDSNKGKEHQPLDPKAKGGKTLSEEQRLKNRYSTMFK